MIKIALLSAAHMHVYGYAEALKKIPDVHVLGIYDDQVERAEAFAKRTGLAKVDKVEDLLQEADAVIICAENANHLRYVELAVSYGKPILCEKPLAAVLKHGKRILQITSDACVPLYMSLPVRFSTSIQKLKSTVQSGSIGRIVAMTGTNHGSVPGGWFEDVALSGGGAVADHIPHVVDVMRLVNGSEVVEVYAEIAAGNFAKTIDDSAILTMTWADGTFSTLDPSWSRISGMYPEWGDFTLEVVGTQGVAYVDISAQKIDRFGSDSPNHRFLTYGDNMDFYMVEEFISCVREKRLSDWLATGEDGLHALAVTAAAYQSAKTGKPVAIKDV
ncbi:MAG: Gfo/Idh/MocA family protein [Bacilli bacterium]